ncbi:MAG: helix-turn-helix transcriptional regulator [Cyanothece sp. SIO1E1]|nr:helix-turn-helix transcriptional regulator [Cyanothece sp. SIO1E1]
MLNQIFDGAMAQKRSETIAYEPPLTLAQIATDRLYSEAIDLGYAACRPLTSAMERLIGQILSCPYQGSTRRTYLEHKALALVSLYLEAMIQPPLSETDLNCIYQAASVLREQIVSPPTVEMLARWVGTNRFKLNQGFHRVYGTTPFGYLRDCRLAQAEQLLMTSELSIEKVATAVGYSSRSHFATAFRQQMGLNPKAFQMQAWQWAS